MTEEQYLLTRLGEECAEVIQRCSKAISYGLLEVQEGQKLTNERRLLDELNDLLGVWTLLCEKEILKTQTENQVDKAVTAKINKILKYMKYSKDRGILE